MADEDNRITKRRQLVHEYFAGCTTADPARIAATCADGAVIYDTTLQPMRGKEAIGKIAAAATRKFGAVGGWTVDRMMADEDGLGIEWTMNGKLGPTPFALRGAEHYSFVIDTENSHEGLTNELISEIRQYPSTIWGNIGKRESLGLMEFPYLKDPPPGRDYKVIPRPASFAAAPTPEAVARRRRLVYDYFAACTKGDPGAIGVLFAPDAVIYDTNHPPIRGREAIGNFWNKIHAKWKGAAWTIDRMVADREELGIEWTMTGTNQAGEPFAVRGAEHYGFAGEAERPLISEIRQYWIFDAANPGSELIGFNYDSSWAKAPKKEPSRL